MSAARVTMGSVWHTAGQQYTVIASGRGSVRLSVDGKPGVWIDTNAAYVLRRYKPGPIPAKTEYEADIVACYEHPDVDLGED